MKEDKIREALVELLYRNSYGVVVANILKQPLIDLATDMARHVAKDGRIVMSGILTTQADDVTAAYQAVGFALDRRDDMGDWTTLVMIRT